MRAIGGPIAAGILSSLLAVDAAAAEPLAGYVRPKTETDGLAVSTGIGSQYSFVGVQAAYYLQVPRSLFRVVPHAGAGLWPCVGDAVDCSPDGVLGVMTSWGHKHRISADLFYGMVNYFLVSLHGERAHAEAVSGIGLAVGYEYMAFSGWFFRIDAGAVYGFGPPIVNPEKRFWPAVTLIGVGYKIW